jgi:hypothetical protein
MLLGAQTIEGSVGARDRMAQRHPRLRQDDDQCTRAAPPSGCTSFRRREGRRDGSWTSRPGCRGRTTSSIGRRGGQLVVETARQVLDYTGGTLVMPMTVLVEQYRREVSTGLAQHAIPVRHHQRHPRDTRSAPVELGSRPGVPGRRSPPSVRSRSIRDDHAGSTAGGRHPDRCRL